MTKNRTQNRRTASTLSSSNQILNCNTESDFDLLIFSFRQIILVLELSYFSCMFLWKLCSEFECVIQWLKGERFVGKFEEFRCVRRTATASRIWKLSTIIRWFWMYYSVIERGNISSANLKNLFVLAEQLMYTSRRISNWAKLFAEFIIQLLNEETLSLIIKINAFWFL